jgi:N4-gp56 family major capsid protein
MATTTYGDISPAVAAVASKELIKRAQPYLVVEKFLQAKPLPANNTKTIKFRRYNALPNTPKYLVEGVTPNASVLTATDVTAVLQQMGDGMQITDVVLDTHTDPVLQEATAVLGEQAAQMVERMRLGVLTGGTNVVYNCSTSTGRTNVNLPLHLGFQRKITRTLKAQNARQITEVIRSTPSFETANVAASFVALVHPDLEVDIRNMTNYVPIERYGSLTPFENEVGKVEDVRYLSTTLLDPSILKAAGSAKALGSTTYSGITSGPFTSITVVDDGIATRQAEVYPVIFLAKDAAGTVPLKGMNAISPMVVNPKPSDSDPWAQRGWVTWKTMQTAVILNDLFMVRAEVAALSL